MSKIITNNVKELVLAQLKEGIGIESAWIKKLDEIMTWIFAACVDGELKQIIIWHLAGKAVLDGNEDI